MEERGEGERIYTIPLRDVKKAPRWKRSNRAIALVRDFLLRHTKASYVVIGNSLNERIWSRGAQKPPSRVRVRVTKEDEETVRAELVE